VRLTRARGGGFPGLARIWTETASASPADAIIARMPDSSLPVEWHGRQAVVVLPEHVDLANAGPVRDQLLAVINRGAAVVIVDMTGTISCDHAGMDAVARAYQQPAGRRGFA
jgi:hypothetical protein